MTENNSQIRRIHLGIDFGTSQSKVIFRDYSRLGGDVFGAYAVVVRPTAEEGGDGDFRIPSTVTWLDDELLFGRRAELAAASEFATPYRSLKVRMALPTHYYGDETKAPVGLSIEDLCTLFVLYLIQCGDKAVHRYPPSSSGRVQMTMTLGVPMSQLDHPELATLFLRVAHVASSAFRLKPPDLANGLKVDDAIEILRSARASVAGEEAATLVGDWIRAEASAALIWAFNSPLVRAGLYAVVDVGAGTTGSSWFWILETMQGEVWTKTKMAFFGAACNPPGADAIEFTVATAVGQNPASLRGTVNKVFDSRPVESIYGLSRICDAIVRTYREAFGRAYSKDRRQSAWHGAKLFLIGGGSLIDPVREQLMGRAWPHLDADPPIVEPGHPTDLFEESGAPYVGEPRFLLVAYGLSHLGADVPDVTHPSEIPPFVPLNTVHRDINHEDLYGER